MKQNLALISLVVPDYDEAITYFCSVLGFELKEDSVLTPEKRWVVVQPAGGGGCGILLAKAATDEQKSRIGNQTGGRVFLFLHTDDFMRDYTRLTAAGVEFLRGPVVEAYGTVGVFKDRYGNLWDLIEPPVLLPE
ncbi:MAG: VOC family protein [Bacteroidetes bacterium]|nr:VOC family protein [Bacteroidota bacterium]